MKYRTTLQSTSHTQVHHTTSSVLYDYVKANIRVFNKKGLFTDIKLVKGSFFGKGKTTGKDFWGNEVNDMILRNYLLHNKTDQGRVARGGWGSKGFHGKNCSQDEVTRDSQWIKGLR